MTFDAGSDGWYFSDQYEAESWTFGKEVWCNLEGRYMFLIADLSQLIGPYSSYEMSLCQLGIMGTEYVQS